MRFTVLPAGGRPIAGNRNRAYLVENNWDDWFKYNTQYDLYITSSTGELMNPGFVKIGQFGMARGQKRPDLPQTFSSLPAMEFFSLGQDAEYYEFLRDHERGSEILRALSDVVQDDEIFERSLDEDVTGTSLLRYVPVTAVKGEYRRLLYGEDRHASFSLNYEPPVRNGIMFHPDPLTFKVFANSNPPTNVHVLIGRNGVGKTTLLNDMARCLVPENAAKDAGRFTDFGNSRDAKSAIANLVSVTFSAFDPFEPLSQPQNRTKRMEYHYIGLKKKRPSPMDRPSPPKGISALAGEFGKSVKACLQGARQDRWRRALEMLETDPIFKDFAVADLADDDVDDAELRDNARAKFSDMSSGHKIVLLTITRLVETVAERSLVLIDEPEAHLHPPLLSAFIRALSDLLVSRNGVAIVATHSPVVLQEVPLECAWKLTRSGSTLRSSRPENETFGENVGVLTTEVFGLEVTASGYHRMLREAVLEHRTDYQAVLDQFDNKLGGEARAILQALVRSNIH